MYNIISFFELTVDEWFLNNLPGAQRDNDVIEADEGHGAAILSLRSQVMLKPVVLSYITCAGLLRNRQPMFMQKAHQ